MPKAKNVFMIVKVLGWLVSVIGALLEELKDLLGDNEEAINERLHHLVKPDGRKTVKKMAALIAGQEPTTSAPAPANWWDKFLEMMISACGFVSFRNSDINSKNFPYDGGDLDQKHVETLSIKQKLRELGRSTMPTQEVKDYIDSQGYRSATLVELLWWWLKNPDKHKDCLVFALGSVWRALVPYVLGDGGRRELDLLSAENDWDEHCLFAVVRK